MPPALVKFGDRDRAQDKVVCQENEALAGIWIDIFDPSQRSRISTSAVFACEPDGLIAAQSCGLVDAPVIDPSALEVFLGTRHEEGGALLKHIKTSEIDVSSIHDIERARFENQEVEGIDIVHFSAGNVDKTRNVAAEIDQRVELDGALALAKSSPGEELQTEIDRGRIEGVNRFFETDRQRFAGIEFAGVSNEVGGKIEKDAPVPGFFGHGQSIAGNRTTDTDVVQFGLEGVQAGFDVPQAGSEGQLRKSHTQELIETGESAHPIIAAVFADELIEIALGQESHELREQKLPGVHRQVLSRGFSGETYGKTAGEVEIDTWQNPP